MTQSYETREQWLLAAVAGLRPFFQDAGQTIPMKLRASCGWPSTGGTRSKHTTIGQCFQRTNSADGHYEIFIHPGLDEPVHVLETLVHEIGHAALPEGTGHKAPFARFCKAIGLEGKPTATHAGEDLRTKLVALAETLGKYPHGALVAGGKKQGTRLLAVRCTQCECVVRMTAKWLDEVGPPTCGCGAPMEESGRKDDEMISLKTLEQMVVYETPDARFAIRFVKDRQRGNMWYLVDYEHHGRLTLCDDKQDCLDTLAAIREGMHVYEDVEVEDESDYEVDEFELNHSPFFEALTPEHHMPMWETEIDGEHNDEDGINPFSWEEAKGVTPTWDCTRDRYDETEPPEVVPATRPEPTPETVAFFGESHLRA